MKKIILVSLALIAAAFVSTAQKSEYAPVFGVKADFDINIPSKWKGPNGKTNIFDKGVGGALGIVCRVPFLQAMYVEPGVSIFYDRYSFDDVYILDAENAPESSKYEHSYKVGLRVPFVLGYNFKFTEFVTMTVYTGPEFNWAFAGKYTTNLDKGSTGDIPTDPFEDQRRVDLSWKLGLGFPISNFLIGVNGSFGITDLMKDPDISFRENRVTVSLAYYF